jgi:hypothetical protein
VKIPTPFNGHVKDVRVFSDCLEPMTLLKYSRQRFNVLNTEYRLSFAMRMDESLGLDLLETVSGTKITM